MAFRIKDLMIQVVPRGRTGPGGEACACTESGATCDCSPSCNTCTKKASDNFLDVAETVSNPADLLALKRRLGAALAKIEAREPFVMQNATPRTRREIEALESKLTAALEELRAAKETVGRSPRGR